VTPLRIVVLEQGHRQPPALAAQLGALGAVSVQTSPDPADALRRCLVSPIDIVMACLAGEVEAPRALLHRLAALPRPPALAFYGCAVEVGLLETTCLHLGLCYLGFFGQPFDDERLQRMADQMRRYGQGVTP